MKIIDLLNKIANGEEVPKKMKIKQWEYDEENENLEYELFDRLIEEDVELNDEVEILEEKKIPEKLDLYDEGIDILNQEYYINARHSIHKSIISLECKYNQLIDYLKSKGNDK